MRRLKNETVVGVIIFCSLILLILSLMWLEDIQLRGRGYIIEAQFEEVSGLNRGDPVTVSGLPIGRVQEMTLEGTGVLVKLRIDGEHRLLRGSLAVIKSQGVMGEKTVDILPGAGPELLESGQKIPGRYQQDLNQIISQVGSMGNELQSVLLAIRFFLDDTSRGGLRQTFAEMGSASTHLRELFSNNAQRLDETIIHLHQVSSRLSQVVAGQEAEHVLSNLEVASGDLATTAQHLRFLSAAMDSLLEPTFQGRSTVGKLLSDETLYRDCRLLIGHLDSLILDVQRNPQKYLKIEIF